MSLLAVVPAGRIGAVVVSNLVVVVVDLFAARRLWQAEPGRFRFGSWARAGWVVVVFAVTWHVGVVALPVGAVLARSRLWSPPGSGGGAVPYAEGEQGWPEDPQ